MGGDFFFFSDAKKKNGAECVLTGRRFCIRKGRNLLCMY
jgi:hypothetical protein